MISRRKPSFLSNLLNTKLLLIDFTEKQGIFPGQGKLLNCSNMISVKLISRKNQRNFGRVSAETDFDCFGRSLLTFHTVGYPQLECPIRLPR